MSTPVRGADGPLGYAPRWARGSGSGRADPALDSRARSSVPVQELPQDLRPPRVVTSHRDAVTGRDVAAARDTAPARDAGSARDTVPLADAAFEPGPEPPLEPASHWDTKPSRAPVAAPAAAPDALWKRKKRPVVFEGDAALRELRSRLASAPDQTPEPPLYQAKTPIFAAVARLGGVMVLAAVGALGFLWITSPHGAPPVASKPGGGDVALVSYPYRGLEAQQKPPSAAESAVPQRAPDAPASGSPWAVANYNVTDVGTPPATLAPRPPGAPRPTASPPPAFRVTAPPPAAPAPAATAPAPPPALPPTPAAVAPMPPPVAPTPVAAPPPAASVPAPKAPPPAIATPVPALPPATSPAAASDRDEIAALLARARTYLSAGDVAAARLVLRRAAERDDPQAALALGGTYDPIVLKRLGIVNFQADPAQAKDWYRRAAQLGSADASIRLEQLVQTDR
jgi:hypothetical protein